MSQVIDTKSIGRAVDAKSTTQSVIDTKSTGKVVLGETIIYTESRSISAGQMIPWAGFTYPTGLTFNVTRL